MGKKHNAQVHLACFPDCLPSSCRVPVISRSGKVEVIVFFGYSGMALQRSCSHFICNRSSLRRLPSCLKQISQFFEVWPHKHSPFTRQGCTATKYISLTHVFRRSGCCLQYGAIWYLPCIMQEKTKLPLVDMCCFWNFWNWKIYWFSFCHIHSSILF